jgi:hypothetical protein
MKYRVGIWACVGLLVAAAWALFASATAPHTNEAMRNLWVLAGVTCPALLAGMQFPLSLSGVLAANAVTYALVGLIVEGLRSHMVARG